MDLKKRRFQFLAFIIGYIFLSVIGDEATNMPWEVQIHLGTLSLRTFLFKFQKARNLLEIVLRLGNKLPKDELETLDSKLLSILLRAFESSDLESLDAGKCRETVGEKGSSQTGKFSIFDCFDGGSGTLVCGVKESVKYYTNNIRTVHVELARSKAYESSLADALSQGIESKTAAKQAKKAGEKAAKLANKNANRILGPIVSSGWDLFETIYYQGSVTEGSLRSFGTLCGTYMIGFLAEERYGKLGYLIGSQFGSWIGGNIGLMAYDLVSAMHFLLKIG